jgi:hypothetical protein
MTIIFSLDSNLEFYFKCEINVSPTVTKFPKLPKLILFVKNMYVFNIQIRKNSIKTRFIKYKSTRHLQALLPAANLTRVLI